MKWTDASSFLCLAHLAGACLLPEERAGGSIRRHNTRQIRNSGKAIGTGDRFNGGALFPIGLGSGNETDMSTILNVKEVNSALQGLAKEYGFETFTTPYTTYEGATMSGGTVGGQGTCDETYRVFLNGAIHARERGSSDNVLYFIADLLYAEKHGTGLTYGDKTYTNADVVTALSTGIVFLPLSNPDGVAYDQSTNSCWRKNRNPAAATNGDDDTVGVDLNRNFDFVWDLSKWATSVADEVASEDPSSEVYHGEAAFSEPETQSIKWVMDTYSKVRWFLDLHSYAGDILYSWGSDTDQSTNTAKNFLNSAYDSVRGKTSDSTTTGYGEYISSADLDNVSSVGKRMGTAMDAATGRSYTVMQSAYLYPTSGASDDYAFSRHFADPDLNLAYGYTVEFGFGNNKASCPFYPTDAQYIQNLQETNAGFMEFLLGAAEVGLGDSQAC
ncbi:Uu.00g131050.m01.CDS01 [Anthostomella pinea]|uniref:Uu.00g131050.m01.CDS01 n=1 Tax=Anthostomella pinea TaxID=933095 RepID=A0AAI8VJJ3_9PEZI|nr:Uu.00g131050.m01.CDS01 [Anthostomella pinea]